MPFKFSIPSKQGPKEISLEAGASAFFCGANGSGKTRLAVYIEENQGLNAHRISAHRALTLNPHVVKIPEKTALARMRVGRNSVPVSQAVVHRRGSRWGSKAAVSLLNDFDPLVQALYAEQSNTALKSHKRARAGDFGHVEATKFELLCYVWERLLPKRSLVVSGDDIRVSISGTDSTFSASEMSDGERAIFYLIGQALLAKEESLLIIDEPELHVHRSIMAKLWDELESVRSDCAFVFITHDLEFAAARVGQKFVIREFGPGQNWEIERVVGDTGFGEELESLILGSRHRVIFVEGTGSSLDCALYRCCFPNQLVVPRGSCEDVIHAVTSMRNNASLTRLECSGIVDADDLNQEEIERLGRLGIAVLPVAEIENIVLMPEVSRAIAEHDGFTGEELEGLMSALESKVFKFVMAPSHIDRAVARYCKRRVYRLLRSIDLGKNSSINGIVANYKNKTSGFDLGSIAADAKATIERTVKDRDIRCLLSCFDNKGLLALAARHLKNTKRDKFESWLVRVLKSDAAGDIAKAIRSCIPELP